MSLCIAILAPIKRAITPDTTVSRNRVIVDLVTGLTARGHKVTIFGTGGSSLPGVTVIPVVPVPLTELPPSENEFYQHTGYLTLLLSAALRAQGEFDIIHNHMYPEYLAMLVPFATPLITTVHSQMTPLTSRVLQQFPGAHLIAISRMAQAASGIAGMDVVHNSVDTKFFAPIGGVGNYLLSVGRMSKAKDASGKFLDPKGIGNAIAIAQKAGLPLKIVGNVEDPAFFDQIVKPHLGPRIEFVGKVSPEQSLTRDQMRALFAGALAFINPINWEEPFGLVMAEALSCGTPVVAYNRGAASEIVEDGKTGFVVDPAGGIDAMEDAVKRVGAIDRAQCREHAVANFSTERMVNEYEKLYQKSAK